MARRQKDILCLIFGVLLIIVGAIGLVYPEVTLKRTKTIKLGPVSIEEPQKQIIRISPIVAVAITMGGAVLIYLGIKKE
ncbi:MAG: hypothetical protein A2W63_03320 [Deltaproteobacteria bacterium RIFCSPLOWO2_02_44_9]|nr:MAG: hypothetical protein A2W63_03320 [Deltaproteobacteria bacterium RIFCSPLOWO2_02_44_9]